MIGSLAVCTNGNFIAALQNGFAFIDKISGEIKMITDPESHLPGNRFNEENVIRWVDSGQAQCRFQKNQMLEMFML